MADGQATSGRGKWMALTAALLGWLFDGLEMGLFPLTARSALLDLGIPLSDHPLWLGIITAFFLVGAATGGVLFGWLGDRIGRVRAMILSVVTYALFSGLTGFAAQAWQIGVLRFIAALGMGGEWSLGVALINEIWPGRSRAFLAGLIGAAANVGYLVIALVGRVVVDNIQPVRDVLLGLSVPTPWVDYLVSPENKGWRLLMMFGAAPALLTLFIRMFVPESERWESERAKGATSHWATRDLLAVLVGALAACGIIGLWAFDLPMPLRVVGTVAGLIIVTGGYLYPVILYLRRAAQAEGPRAVGQGTLGLMVLAACLSGVALLGTWGTVQQVPPWSSALTDAPASAASQVQIWSAFGAIVGTVLAALVADVLGRRVTYTLLCLGSLIIVPTMFLGSETFDARFLFIVFLAGAITAAFYGWLPLYLPELFPTRVRATGQGFLGFNFGRVIASIGVLQLGNLKQVFAPYDWKDAHVYSLLASIYVVGMVIIWLAPETKGKPLPE